MSEKEVVEIASKSAQQQGYPIEHYTIRAAQHGLEWHILFQRKSDVQKPSPGDFFTVYIDDTTGDVLRIVDGK